MKKIGNLEIGDLIIRSIEIAKDMARVDWHILINEGVITQAEFDKLCLEQNKVVQEITMHINKIWSSR